MTDLELKQWLAGAGEKSAKRWKKRSGIRTVNEKEWLTYVRARLSEKEQNTIKEEEELDMELAEMGMTREQGNEYYHKITALRKQGKHKEASELIARQAIKVKGIDMDKIEARLKQKEADKAAASSHAATAFRGMLEPGQWDEMRDEWVRRRRDKEDAASGKGSEEKKGGRKTRRRRKTKRKRKSKKSRTRKRKKRRKSKRKYRRRKSRGRK